MTRSLRAVDSETGEVVEGGCPDCARKDDEVAGLEEVIRSQGAKIRELRRDREAAARKHPLWPVALSVFNVWRVECGHPKASWGAEEFELVRPFLEQKMYGKTLEDREDMCLRAIAGAKFDPFVSTRKNGSRHLHNEFDLVFRSRSKFREFCRKAPAGWLPPSRDDQQTLPVGP